MDGKKWLELINRLEKLEGSKILKKLRHLAISNYTLNKNFYELIKLINYYEKDLSIWSVENRVKLDACQKEFLRLLHNYIASSYSLREHTRKFKEKLDNEEFTSFYEAELKRLSNDELIAFRKDLRSYMQHQELPLSSAQISFRKDEKTNENVCNRSLCLNKENLLSWKGWGKLSKQYLVKQTEKNIDIKKFLHPHHQKLEEFYKDLYNKVCSIYEKDLIEHLKVEKEIMDLQKEEQKELSPQKQKDNQDSKEESQKE